MLHGWTHGEPCWHPIFNQPAHPAKQVCDDGRRLDIVATAGAAVHAAGERPLQRHHSTREFVKRCTPHQHSRVSKCFHQQCLGVRQQFRGSDLQQRTEIATTTSPSRAAHNHACPSSLEALHCGHQA